MERVGLGSLEQNHAAYDVMLRRPERFGHSILFPASAVVDLSNIRNSLQGPFPPSAFAPEINRNHNLLLRKISGYQEFSRSPARDAQLVS